MLLLRLKPEEIIDDYVTCGFQPGLFTKVCNEMMKVGVYTGCGIKNPAGFLNLTLGYLISASRSPRQLPYKLHTDVV